jgi:glycosyltransferase involved in cell wall biosynthesis
MLLNAAILQAPVRTADRWAGTGWLGDPPAAELVDEPLRLLHVVPTYLPALRYGGPIRSVHALCRALAADGHDVHVFTTSVDGPADSDVPLGRPVDLEGVKVTYFPSRRLRRLYWSPPMRRAFALSVGGFDLVHLHAVYLWPIWAGARAARAHGVPYVVSPRGMLVPELIRRKSRWVKAAWIALVERANLEAAAAIHTTSSVEASHLCGFGWKLPPIATIPHGVDDPPPPSAAPPSDDIAAAIADGPLVLAFGRISWEKGLDRLIAALPQAPAARVTIVARHVEGEDKEALFAAARLFAMTSLSENFGLAAFEAMRRGVPVLATPDVGMSEIVRESGAGRVVEAAPAAIAAGISTMLDDVAGSRAMGEAGRAQVVAHYGWPNIARRMADLYGSVAEPRRRGGARP